MRIKKNIFIMYAIALLQGMVFYAPVATLYRQAAGVSIFQITIIESISLAVCVGMELPWGILADRIGYRSTMIFCCLLYFLSKIIFWQANGFGAFLLERILLGIIFAGLSGVDTSVLYLSSREDSAQGVFGVYDNLGTIGLLSAAAVFSLFIKDNYRLAGLLTVVSYGIAAVLVFGLTEVKPKRRERQNLFSEFKNVIHHISKNKTLVLLLLAVALLNETHQTITTYLNQLQYEKCGISTGAMGYIYIIMSVLGLLGGLSARLTNRFGMARFGTVLFLACILACGTLTVTDSAVFSVLSIVCLHICYCLFQPLQVDLQNRQVASANRATALSVNALLMDGIAIATNIVFGKLAEMKLSYAMALGTAFCTAGLILFLLWGRGRSRTCLE